MTPDEFRVHGHALIDWIAEYIENIEQYPVASTVQPLSSRTRGAGGGEMPATPPAAWP